MDTHILISSQYISHDYLLKSSIDLWQNNTQKFKVMVDGGFLPHIPASSKCSLNLNITNDTYHSMEAKISLLQYYISKHGNKFDKININSILYNNKIDDNELINLHNFISKVKKKLCILYTVDNSSPSDHLKAIMKIGDYSEEVILVNHTKDFNDFLIFCHECRKSISASLGIFDEDIDNDEFKKLEKFKPDSLVLTPQNAIQLNI